MKHLLCLDHHSHEFISLIIQSSQLPLGNFGRTYIWGIDRQMMEPFQRNALIVMVVIMVRLRFRIYFVFISAVIV